MRAFCLWFVVCGFSVGGVVRRRRRVFGVVNIMTLTQKFYFKLINALLDAAAANACNRRKILDCVTEQKLGCASAYNSGIEICIRDALTLMTSNASMNGEALGLSASAAAATWFVGATGDAKALERASPT